MDIGRRARCAPPSHDELETSYRRFADGLGWDTCPPSLIDPSLLTPPDTNPEDTTTPQRDDGQPLGASTQSLHEMDHSMSEMGYGGNTSSGGEYPTTSFMPTSSAATANPSNTSTYGPTPSDILSHDGTLSTMTANGNIATSSSRAATAARSRLKTPTGIVKAKKPARPKKARSQCSGCGKSFQPPKTTDTTQCHPCRTSQGAPTTLLASVATPGPSGDATIMLPVHLAMTALNKSWDAKITSSEDAKTQLLSKAHYSIQVLGDDVASIDTQTIDRFSKDLFAALLKTPVQPPKEFDEGKKAKYRASQLDAYAKCANSMQTEEEVGDASARCWLAVEDAITLHTDGIRLNELTKESAASLQQQQHETKKKNRQPAKPKTRTGFNMDVNVSCTQRIEIMIQAVSENKLVALELLDGRKVLDFVRCPTNFLERKMDNFKCNRTKHDDEKVGGDARRKKEAGAPLDPQAQAGSNSQHEVPEQNVASGEGFEMLEEVENVGCAAAGASQGLDGNGFVDFGVGAGEAIDGPNGRDETGPAPTPFTGEGHANMAPDNSWMDLEAGGWVQPEDMWESETSMAGTWTNTDQQMFGEDSFNDAPVVCTAAQPYPVFPPQAGSGGRAETTEYSTYNSGF